MCANDKPGFEWEYISERPGCEGWYAIQYCWDVEEGVWVGSAYYDGKEWKTGLPVTSFAGPFGSEIEAARWAADHDCSF